jgi:hypothetical protein
MNGHKCSRRDCRTCQQIAEDRADQQRRDVDERATRRAEADFEARIYAEDRWY